MASSSGIQRSSGYSGKIINNKFVYRIDVQNKINILDLLSMDERVVTIPENIEKWDTNGEFVIYTRRSNDKGNNIELQLMPL